MSPSERLILTLRHKTLRAYCNDRLAIRAYCDDRLAIRAYCDDGLAIRVLGICEDVKMNCGEIRCQDER